MMQHDIILVDEADVEIGAMEKMEAHRKALLHRAFSVFIFNAKQQMLLQQRAHSKYHSGGLWTNTCCSHPRPGEDTRDAAARRLSEEMGFSTELTEIFQFTYKHAFDNGLTEYEFDHVYIGYYDGPVVPDRDEAGDYCFMQLEEIEESLARNPEKFSPWFRIAFPMVRTWLERSGDIKRME